MYCLSTTLYLFTFIYGIIVIKDIKSVVEEKADKTEITEHKTSLHTITDFFDLRHVKKAFLVTFKQGNDNKKVVISYSNYFGTTEW